MEELEVISEIRKIMKENKIKQRQIAKECGISENYINQMLGLGKSKRRKISSEVLKYFGFSRIEIYNKIEEEIEDGRNRIERGTVEPE